MYEDAVDPQVDEPMDQIVAEAEAAHSPQEVQDAPEDSDQEQSSSEKKMVPLSALQKVREKKRELELELQWERQRNAQAAMPQTPKEEDNSRYESATREDLKSTQEEVLRQVEEKLWIRQNPEKAEMVNENLQQFLKQRPHLAASLKLSPNRYEEAYTLMNAFLPQKTQQLQKAPKAPVKEAPNSPGGVPKGAALNEAVDVMNMSDAEFHAWRETKRKRR